jgi:hypothetical protein
LHERTITLRASPTGFAEVNLEIQANATVAWTWTATGGPALRFSVHSHVADHVVEHLVVVNAPRHEGNFTAPMTGSYSLLWEATSVNPVTVSYKVTGDARLADVNPVFPPQEGRRG